VSHAVTRKTLEEAPVLFARRRAALAEIPAALAELLPAVFAAATETGAAIAGPPFCRYRDMDSDALTLEAGLPLAAPAAGRGEIEAGALRPGPAATTLHVGPYDELPQAHAAVQAWIAEQGLTPADAPWEVYLTDPGQVPDPAEWQTEVIWPVQE